MKIYLQGFKKHETKNHVSQKNSVDWLTRYHGDHVAEAFAKYSVSEKYIQKRVIYAPGIAGIPSEPQSLYEIYEDAKPSLSDRAKLAQNIVEDIFTNLYKGETDHPDHINHVSCTHYQSPSAAQKMIVRKEWFDKTNVTHVYHMGCYAAFPAVRVAKGFVADGASRADIVHTELCSFHLDKDNVTPEQIIMKTLFSDGAIKYSVVNEEIFLSSDENGLEVLSQHEITVPGTDKEMSWLLGPSGFLMTLTKKVPLYLETKIEEYVHDLFNKAGLDYNEVKDKTIFAIHPGGPKIIDLMELALGLSPEQVKHSKCILNTRGNMSSATIPHIWNEIIEDDNSFKYKYVASVAFGPGLTMTGAMLKLCKA